MKSLNALSRMLTNSQRSTELLFRIFENLDNQSASTNEKLDRIFEATDHQTREVNARFDQFLQAYENQSATINTRLDALLTAWNNQASAANARLDTLIKANEAQLDVRNSASGPSRPQHQLLPRASAIGGGGRARTRTNDLEAFQPIIDDLVPWSGHVPKGYLVDFLGVLTDAEFRAQFGIDPDRVGGTTVTTEIPLFEQANAEWWFETVNWFVAAQEARDNYVMVTLGACYGAQAVGAYRALQLVNPMPCKLVAVEGDPENFQWLQRHFRDNGIEPSEHWLLPVAISDRNSPVFFPTGAPGSGANNCFATNDANERRLFADQVIAQGKAEETLKNLMMHNSTGIIRDLIPGQDVHAEVKSVSAVTLRDVLGPFEVVDYVEADIQQSEILVFPPFLDLLRRKVRRIHIGTHGIENHKALHQMFEASGWEIVFSYEPDMTHEGPLGTFLMNDGVLTVRNPDL